jgi:hypothetical protein
MSYFVAVLRYSPTSVFPHSLPVQAYPGTADDVARQVRVELAAPDAPDAVLEELLEFDSEESRALYMNEHGC